MVRLPISGRLRAAAMNLFTLSDRNWTSSPDRSSRMNVNPPDVPTPGMAGGEKPKATPSGSLLNSAFRRALMAWNCSARVLRSSQSFMLMKTKRVVAGSHQAEQAEARDAGGRAPRRESSAQNFSIFATTCFGALQRSGVGKLDVQVEVALVLIGNEAGGQFAADPIAATANAGQQNQRTRLFRMSSARTADVAVGGPPEHAVEPAEESRQQPSALASSASAAALPARG